MKSVYFLFSVFVFGCTQGPRHPQSTMMDQPGTTMMDERSILSFKDSIDHNLGEFDKQNSMIYMNDKGRIYVDQYSDQGKPVLFIEQMEEENIQKTLTRYYLKNDSLIFVFERRNTRTSTGDMINDKRSFFRNNTLFKTQIRSAESEMKVNAVPYEDWINKQEPSADRNYSERINILEDAAAGRNRFEMLFDHLNIYSDEAYLVLKSREPYNYTAKILVKQRDAFIDSLSTMPGFFKDKKLKIAWKVENKEAIYIPSGPQGITSANGLNK